MCIKATCGNNVYITSAAGLRSLQCLGSSNEGRVSEFGALCGDLLAEAPHEHKSACAPMRPDTVHHAYQKCRQSHSALIYTRTSAESIPHGLVGMDAQKGLFIPLYLCPAHAVKPKSGAQRRMSCRNASLDDCQERLCPHAERLSALSKTLCLQG